jgi:hypothetical protein
MDVIFIGRKTTGMAIQRIPGQMLESNLTRSTNLTFQTNLLTVDVVNSRIGIGTANPAYRLDINGAANIGNNLTIGGNTTIAGNLTVTGDTTVVNTTNVSVEDNFMVLNASGSQGSDAGIIIDRNGAGNNAVLYWDEGGQKFKVVLTTSDGSTVTNITDSSFADFQAGIITGSTVSVDGVSITQNEITATRSNDNLILRTTGTGNIDVDGAKIINLGTPSAATDAATKGYADSSQAVNNVLYVSASGSDSNTGQSLGSSFASIAAALTVATAGTTVFVKSGTYTINNPLTIPAGVSLVGDNLRNSIVLPQNTNQDMFYVNNGNIVTGFTFRNHVSPAAVFAFNPNGSAGAITASPYLYNCTSSTTTGTAIRINGAHATGGKSMIIGQCTVINQGGKGVHILNGGYSQIVALYTICNDIGVLCESGGQCSMNSSDNSFGNYGIVANGVSSALISGTTSGSNSVAGPVVITGISTRPAVNDVVQFAGDSNYYTIDTSTAIVGGSSTVTFLESIPTFANGIAATVYRRSLVTASAHTFEYVGTGTSLSTARPADGGVPIQTQEVVQTLGGRVNYTSTDQKGNFRIGDDLLFDRTTGTITGRTFSRSLFGVMTPYILALEGSFN